MKKKRHPAFMIILDILAVAVIVGGIAAYRLLIPETYVANASGTEAVSTAASAADTSEKAVSSDTGTTDWGEAFADKFTEGEIIETDTSYMSKNVNVTMTTVQEDGVTYYVQDIYVRSIENLQTAFAEDTYGKAVTDWVLDMAIENDAVAAINGDYYGVESGGVVIRNGVLYRDDANADVLVLYYDGTMKGFSAAEFDADLEMANGAYQAWNFGPLLVEEGTALTSFSSRISGTNPRTAIGCIEPGHYVFITVDGRQAGYSSGMTLKQLAATMESLGCQVAYNLDGGQTSTMTFGDEIANQPYKGGRLTSDIIFITDGE
ncbi:phosphodiester glycosidase family protein [Youngiibacter multivorans]|uniref:Exopolysaccharide biosynthesis protein n=1 Tax=Youngiibacter multivorans TaxID=937251 RepID=A0ABS4G5Q8_9CLOT|nr:phosphodiester glycosidase family protein [Youngiibacter multivorans]MBP1919897.1 exopolysaccharide biosynthesis protein [Youngiibacter multivorans]